MRELPLIVGQLKRHAGRWLVLLLLLCLAGLPFMQDLRFSNDFRVYFSTENPELSAYESFEEDFASHDSIVILAYLTETESGKHDSWLLPVHHELITEMEMAFWELPTVHRVNTLSNYQYTEALDDEITVTPLLELLSTTIPASVTDKSQIPAYVTGLFSNDPQLDKVYLSDSHRLVVVQADLYLDKQTPGQARQVYDAADQLRNSWQTRYPDIDFYLVGSVTSNVTLEEAVVNDLLLLVPMTYLVIIIGLWVFLRSFKAMAVTLVVVTLSIIFTFSLFSLIQSELTPVAGFVPTVVLTLAVADCVHYLTSYRYLVQVDGLSPREANAEAYSINWLPITITSLTTAVGVMFLNFSDSPPYRDLGNMVAIGVVLAWLFTLLIVPIALDKFPIVYERSDADAQEKPQYEFLERYSHWLRQHAGAVVLVLVGLCLIAALGISQIKFSENWSKYFSDKFEVTRAINLIKAEFNRLHRYELVLRSSTENGINEPAYLETLDELLHFLEQHSDVTQVQSYGYILKRLNQTMHNDDPDKFNMPDSRQLAAQYLLLYELSLPRGMGIENFVTFDKRASRTSILLTPADSNELLVFEQELKTFFQTIRSDDRISLEISGLDHIFSHIAQRNIVQMLAGTTVALLMISILLMILFKSVKYGMISLIPNLVPAFIAYGIWGMTAGYIDLALSVVICMSLGIVVDDSVHFLSKYMRARKHLQLNAAQSIDYSFHIVGKALVTTTVILVAGFAMMLFSPLQPTASTGALLCLTLVVALLVDFTLLPIVLNKVDSREERMRSD